MQTREFFDIVLPSTGFRVIALPLASGHGFRHIFPVNNEVAAAAALRLDTEREQNVFYACASFTTTDSRKGENAQAVRSFWVDLDVGDHPNKYPSRRAALQGLAEFVATVGLPNPFVVSSGGGIHAYWPMQADMAPAEWRETAQFLKAAAATQGLKADPSRTADIASVLRPPGTHHRKAAPALVHVMVRGDVGALEGFRRALAVYLKADLDIAPTPAWVAAAAVANTDLSGGIETTYPPSFAEQVAGSCGIIGMVRDTRGNVDQPTWYAALGVLAFTEEGADVCHEWSAGHPAYSFDETEKKIAQVEQFRPTGCAKLGEQHPAICGECPWRDKITSPIVLGYAAEPTQVIAPTPAQVALATIGISIDDTPVVPDPDDGLPATFRWEGWRNSLTHFAGTDDEDNPIYVPFCDTYFWAENRLVVENQHATSFVRTYPDGKIKRWVMDNSSIGKGGAEVLGQLAAKAEIVPTMGGGKHMDGYLRGWITKLSTEAKETHATQAYGWDGDDFIIGDIRLSPGVPARRAVVQGLANSMARHMAPQGDLATWVDVIDRAYNAPGQEAYQFMVLCGFAAPLLELMQQVSGVTVYAHSEGSGAGKTTAQRAALSIWGNWDEMQLSDNKVTQNMLWGLMGAYHNLPVMFDELTNQPNNVASDLVFSVSSGRAKKRMRPDGEARENNANWTTILLASGNTMLSEKLALHRANAEAELSRLWEFTVATTNHLTPNEALDLFPLLKSNYGTAGLEYAKFLVDNREGITLTLATLQRQLNEDLGIQQSERYWSALLASVLTALSICRRLGLVRFRASALKEWSIAQLGGNRGSRTEAAVQPLDLFGKMLADLWGGVLVTVGEGDMRRGQIATVIDPKPRGQLVGRSILPAAMQKAGAQREKAVLMLNGGAVREWANKRGISAQEMFKAVVAAGWASPNKVSFNLGKGTVEYQNISGYVQCWQVDPEKVNGAGFTGMISDRVNVIQGGADAKQSGSSGG